MEDYLISSYELLRKSTGWNKDREIKQAIDTTINKLRQNKDENIKNNKLSDNMCEKYLQPIVESLISNNLECIEQSLLLLSQLIERGYLKGKEELRRDEPNKTVLDYLIEKTIATLSHSNDEIQMGVIRFLLTAVTSEETEVHENVLLSCIYSIFDVYFAAEKPEVKMVASASLTQIVGYSFMKVNFIDESYMSLAENEDLDFEPSISESTASELFNAINNNYEEERAMSPLYRHSLSHLYGKEKDASNDSLLKMQNEDPDQEYIERLPTIYHKDIFLIIRALGILSLVASEIENSIEYRKMSLSLLTGAFPKAKNIIRGIDIIIECIKKHLLKSLLFNFMSTNTEVYIYYFN